MGKSTRDGNFNQVSRHPKQLVNYLRRVLWAAQRNVLPLLVLVILALNIILAPLIYYRGFHPDFLFMAHYGALFLNGGEVYDGRNAYLPSALLFWAPFALLDVHVGWLIWKLITGAVIIVTLAQLFWFAKRTIKAPWVWLCLLHLGILAGFTPKAGNPGNLVAPMTVLSALLLLRGYANGGGVLLGLALSLKYPLALPLLGLSLCARRIRFAAYACLTCLILNAVALGWLIRHGHTLTNIAYSIVAAARHYGGYDEKSFKAVFSKDAPGKYSTLAAAALWHTAGFDFQSLHMLNMLLLVAVGLGSTWLAFRYPHKLVLALAVFYPAFLTLTYHRYYDSALVAFAVILAWHLARSPKARWRSAGISVVLLSVFLVRSLAYTLVYRLDLPASFYHGWAFNFVLGPAHIYALFALSSLSAIVAFWEPQVAEFFVLYRQPKGNHFSSPEAQPA